MGKEAPRPLTAMEILRKGVKLFWRSCKSMLSTLLIILVLSCLSCYRTWSVVAPSASATLALTRLMASSGDYGLISGRLAGRNRWVADLLPALFVHRDSDHIHGSHGREGPEGCPKGSAVRTRRTWMGVMATSLFVCFLTSGYLSFCVFLLSAVGFFGGVSAASLALIAAVAILEFLLFLYLSMLWSQAVVVSVMEEGRSGLDALGRAAERVRGRKGLGFRVNSLLFLAVALVQTLISTAVTLLSLPNLISPIIFSLVYLLVIVLIQAVNVVFYYECQENQEDAATMKENLAYTRALREEP
ncbi:unnamed protein product [Spirodela intermedia]|uniref:Uncharacterized protein n=1 Tax=Spirodela intermedia TaxID=51605 RepID=A0A7I8IWB4_SPIIN|nr:unnamed protein product [Spirodela intermedia]CAA6662277.1 unnamed protein product [Spirodela intermedia]